MNASPRPIAYSQQSPRDEVATAAQVPPGLGPGPTAPTACAAFADRSGRLSSLQAPWAGANLLRRVLESYPGSGN
jgi:hypothetical protein